MSVALRILNYGHPIPAEQIDRVAAMVGAMPDVVTISAEIDRARPIAEVARDLADAAGLSPEEWQTLGLIINPPGLAPLALALVAEIHGRRGDFPTLLNVRPVPDSTPTRYEVAEVVNLQSQREQARRKR